MFQKAKIFNNGNSQTVSLQKNFVLKFCLLFNNSIMLKKEG